MILYNNDRYVIYIGAYDLYSPTFDLCPADPKNT